MSHLGGLGVGEVTYTTDCRESYSCILVDLINQLLFLFIIINKYWYLHYYLSYIEVAIDNHKSQCEICNISRIIAKSLNNKYVIIT